MNYILKGKTPVLENNLIKWAKWTSTTDRALLQETLVLNHPDLPLIGEVVLHDRTIENISISTVFLGIDHNFCEEGPPILFETMVFGGKFDGTQQRYPTWDEAVQGHEKLKRYILNKLKGTHYEFQPDDRETKQGMRLLN